MKALRHSHNSARSLRFGAAFILAALLAGGCASMGRPEGGPKDVTPPVFVSASPAPGATNVSSNRIRLRFDENLDLKNVNQTVIVSPAQKLQPKITAGGHYVTVELRDTLRDSTTYTIDFGDAIADLNEGNQLDGFAYAFSTGPTIDTLSISGMVFEARNLEPAQGMLVGAYSVEETDTAIRTKPFDRVTRTDQLGQFTLRNLAHGTYLIYALNDGNGDYHWDRSEDIAFLGEAITPTVESFSATDTLKAADGSDSIAYHTAYNYFPNDVILTWFNENYRPAYMTKYERSERNRLGFLFNAPVDSVPEIKIVASDGPLAHLDGAAIDQWAVFDRSAGSDTLDIWITDSTVIKTDSLYLSARYLATDTLDQLSWTTDTLKLFMRKGKNSRKGSSAKNTAAKKGEKGENGEATADSAAVEIPKISVAVKGGAVQQLNRPLMLTVDVPLATLDTLAAKLEMRPEGDSIWVTVPGFHLSRPDGLKLLELRGSPVDWRSEASYRLTIDSTAMTGIYGEILDKPFTAEFKARAADEYSAIFFNISGTDGRPAIVELLDGKDEVVASAPVEPSGRAELRFLEPATYYARIFFDDNRNGLYDSGSLTDSILPEEVAYYPKRIPLKKNWDLEQSWDIWETPLDLQKHSDIKKNKPKKKAGEEDDTEEEEEQQYDEFGRPITNGYQNPFGSSSSSSSSGRRPTNNRFQQNNNSSAGIR